MITVGSCFSGIGGFELGLLSALRDVGIKCKLIWQVEQDPYCLSILQRHWPTVPKYKDITTFLNEKPEPPDIILGGFPCQDLSTAGRQEGINGKKSGLFFTLWQSIRHLGSRWAVLENVSAITLWAAPVLREIHKSGYDAQWSLVSAEQVGAPHLRERWFCICSQMAHHERYRSSQWQSNSKPKEPQSKLYPYRSGGDGQQMANPKSHRYRGSRWLSESADKPLYNVQQSQQRETQPRLGGAADGIPPRLDSPTQWKWPKGRGKTQHPWEAPRARIRIKGDRARLKALGNSIVPQVAYVVGLKLAEVMKK